MPSNPKLVEKFVKHALKGINLPERASGGKRCENQRQKKTSALWLKRTEAAEREEEACVCVET